MASTEMRIWLAHDCFRPASWVSFWLSVVVAIAAPAQLGVPVLGLGILTAAVVIGIGEVPASVALWSGKVDVNRWFSSIYVPSGSELPHGVRWQIFRLLWPGSGMFVGLLASGVLQPAGFEQFLPNVILVGLVITLTTITLLLFFTAGFFVSDTFSGTLLTGWTAITVFGWSSSFIPTWLAWTAPVVLVGLWTCFSGAFLCLRKLFPGSYSEPFESFLRREKSATDIYKQDIFSSVGLLGILPSRSPWRQSIRIISIGILLLAMVCWLLLTASPLPRYEILASTMYGAIAIPAASLLDGNRVVASWDRLAGIRRCAKWYEMLTIPHRLSQATIALASFGAIILWPPLVVSLTSFGTAGVWNALRAAGCLIINMLFTGLVCLVFHKYKARNETVLAFSLGSWLLGTWVTFEVLLAVF